MPGTGVWTVGTVDTVAPATLNMTATVNAVGPYLNSAEVTAADQPDADSTPGNNVPAEDDQDSATTMPNGNDGTGDITDTSVPGDTPHHCHH